MAIRLKSDPISKCSGWLVYILSEADHRMKHGQARAEKRCERLRGSSVEEISGQAFADDWLEIMLVELRDG